MTTNNYRVKKRAVFFVGGFDPKSPEAFYARMDRENGRFERLWKTKISRTPLSSSHKDIAGCRFEASSDLADESWTTLTDFHYLSIDDIVLNDFSKPFYKRLLRYVVSFGDYTVTTAGMKFFWHAWRFSLYALYPMVMLLVSLGLSLMAYSWARGIDSPHSGIAAWVAFLACLAFCYQFAVKRGHVLHLMDLWSFTTEYQYRKRSDMDDKLDRLADQIFAAAASDEYDEILAVGHSTGGALILDAAGRVLERHPQFAEHSSKLIVLTVGSTALKIGLHPFSNWFRSRVQNLFSNSDARWIEFQCVTDIINFHGTDPTQLMGFRESMRTKIYIGTIRIKHMISNDVYQRMKGNFFRIHYQFVYGNTKKYLYDFPAICFGPVTLTERLQLNGDAIVPNPYVQSLTGKPQVVA